MMPREVDIREMKSLEIRLRVFKEHQWKKIFGFNPLWVFLITIAMGALIALSILFIISRFL